MEVNMRKLKRATIFAALVCTILLLGFMPTVLAALPQSRVYLPLVLVAQPTATNTPSPTPTNTPVPGLGAATGRTLWNNQPLAGVTTKLCTTWSMFGGCKTQVYSGVSGEDGRYTITDIPAGPYDLAFKVPGQSEYGFLIGGHVSIAAGQTTTIRDENIIKFDLKLLSPGNHSTVATTPTLTWEAYPYATSYRVYVVNKITSPYVTVVNHVTVTTNQYMFEVPLTAGEYYWDIDSYNSSGTKLAESASYYYFVVAP
jgi:hypothetical protein